MDKPDLRIEEEERRRREEIAFQGQAPKTYFNSGEDGRRERNLDWTCHEYSTVHFRASFSACG